ncbi:MAG: energy transducer TonB [Prevotella sp.]|nr:energy transducer TonB [Prevotella sp.]
MSKIDLLDQQWIDLVFDGKNEAYGAYQIRQNTNRRNLLAMIALILGLAAVVVLFLGVNVASEAIRSAQHQTEVVLDQIDEEAAEEQEEEVVYEQQPEEELVIEETVMNSEKFTAYEMQDEAPEQVTKTQDEVAQSEVAIGAVDFDQGSDEADKVLKVNEKVVDELPPPAPEETKVFEVVEQMPSFPGGDAALMGFLSKNIKYPVIAEENGIQGRVIATFVVERDGSISDVKVVKSVDPSLDKEAVRVLKSMPKWIPGKQNGSAVRVKYTVPVTFKLQ